jgi:hypothetical protein
MMRMRSDIHKLHKSYFALHGAQILLTINPSLYRRFRGTKFAQLTLSLQRLSERNDFMQGLISMDPKVRTAL